MVVLNRLQKPSNVIDAVHIVLELRDGVSELIISGVCREKLLLESLDEKQDGIVHSGEVKVGPGGVVRCLLDKKDSVSFGHLCCVCVVFFALRKKKEKINNEEKKRYFIFGKKSLQFFLT